MANLPGNNIFEKVELPPHGFILQKDVYTTNLLYANDQFPLTALKKRLPFRDNSGKKTQNPSKSVKILRENGKISENSEQKKLFYLYNKFKPKQLKNKKLKFPLPKIKVIPLTNLNLNENINKRDVKIKYIEDDLNITSNNGKKIIFKFKEKKLPNTQRANFPSIFKQKINLTKKNKYKYKINNYNSKIKKYYDQSADKIYLKQIVGELNEELKNIKNIEKERRKAFIRDKFFSTQIYVEKIMDINNKENNISINISNSNINNYN